jgi:hypothetical protein
MFLIKLETSDGAPAEPPTLNSVMRNWKAGDLIPLEHGWLRVIGLRDDNADRPPVLVVEEV